VSSGQSASRDLMRLYRDAIRRHSSEPIGYRRPIDATHRHEAYNPQCGDRVEVLLRVPGETVEAVAFDGEACAICMASASLLCSLAPEQTVADLRRMGEGLQAALREPAEVASGATGDTAGQSDSRPTPPPHPDLQPLLGVRPYPSRVQCALLPWTAAERALSG
jgi:nitrogen fixation NifU-like protein